MWYNGNRTAIFYAFSALCERCKVHVIYMGFIELSKASQQDTNWWPTIFSSVTKIEILIKSPTFLFQRYCGGKKTEREYFLISFPVILREFSLKPIFFIHLCIKRDFFRRDYFFFSGRHLTNERRRKKKLGRQNGWNNRQPQFICDKTNNKRRFRSRFIPNTTHTSIRIRSFEGCYSNTKSICNTSLSTFNKHKSTS